METSVENYPLLISSDEDDLLRNILTRKAIDTSQQTYDNINESFGSYPLLESSSAESGSETKAISNLSDNASFPLLTDSETEIREDNRELKQTDAAAANLQISVQKNSRPSEFSRPLTSITLNLNRDLPVDRRLVSLLKLPNDDILELSNSTDTNEDTCEDDEAEISSIFHHKKTKKKRNPDSDKKDFCRILLARSINRPAPLSSLLDTCMDGMESHGGGRLPPRGFQ